MSSTLLSLPRLILVGLVFVAGFGVGHKAGQAPLQVDLAEQRATTAETSRLRAMAAARALTDAQTLGNQLTERLGNSLAQITTLQKEKADEIRRLTTGRRCLSADAVRVLNTPAGDRASADVPQAPGGADAPDGAFASDYDVGLWISHAQGQYDECRGRLDALIDFVEGQPGGANLEN